MIKSPEADPPAPKHPENWSKLQFLCRGRWDSHSESVKAVSCSSLSSRQEDHHRTSAVCCECVFLPPKEKKRHNKAALSNRELKQLQVQFVLLQRQRWTCTSSMLKGWKDFGKLYNGLRSPEKRASAGWKSRNVPQHRDNPLRALAPYKHRDILRY